MTWLAFKEKTDLEKAGSKSKQTKIKGIPKLDDANDAGTKESINCTLIVTEGDSAKTLAVAGYECFLFLFLCFELINFFVQIKSGSNRS